MVVSAACTYGRATPAKADAAGTGEQAPAGAPGQPVDFNARDYLLSTPAEPVWWDEVEVQHDGDVDWFRLSFYDPDEYYVSEWYALKPGEHVDDAARFYCVVAGYHSGRDWLFMGAEGGQRGVLIRIRL